MVTPQTETERAVFELWKDLRPDEAFVFGLDDCAGHLFIPTQRRGGAGLAQNFPIPKAAANAIERKGPPPFPAPPQPREPPPPPPTLLQSPLGSKIKKRVKEDHIRTLAP